VDDRHGRDERYTHRLEAFSDVVLGFSLGQLAINSAIPPHAIEIVTRPTALFAYVLTFGVVASVWSIHHRLFIEYFVPNRLSTVLNFVALGFVVFLSYTVQVYVHFNHTGSPADASVAATLYFTTLGIVMTLLGVLFLLGSRARRLELSEAPLRRGYSSAARLLCTGLFLAVGVPVIYSRGVSPDPNAFLLLVGGAVIGRLIGWRLTSAGSKTTMTS
jgi:uncharacterized membrane protein